MNIERPSRDFLAGGGEMGTLMRAFNWSGSSLGPPETWPQSLRVTIRLMLNTGHPMFIWWGPDLIQFYNDAYRQTMGSEKHPDALGGVGRDTWAEIWEIIGPQIDHVMSGQGSTWDEDRLVPVTRHGSREDVWWTYSYGPIDLEGRVGGVLVVCNDVTTAHQASEALKHQTRRMEQLFEQAPSFMAVLRGPDHVFELTNAAYRRLIGNRDFIGKPARDAIPDAVGQGFFELLDGVYQTGKAHVGRRMPLALNPELGGALNTVYLDFVYQPIVEANGKVSGIFVDGFEVTDHVRAEQHLRLMNDELKHRVKNTLAMVGAIASQTFGGTNQSPVVKAFHNRLGAFAKAHDILTSQTWATASVDDVIAGALAPYRSERGRFVVSGPAITLGSKQAISLALAVHELATNATKYGALSSSAGRVHVDWREESVDGMEHFRFVWRESGGPAVAEPIKNGFGSQLICRVLMADFGGDVSLDYRPDGLICTLTAPLGNLNKPVQADF
ncbi:MAG: PAS domain-containing protein [Pseudaminobacter sp.]|nr:PAS domain-containing protein [Pseudaminobacter sp.]